MSPEKGGGGELLARRKFFVNDVFFCKRKFPWEGSLCVDGFIIRSLLFFFLWIRSWPIAFCKIPYLSTTPKFSLRRKSFLCLEARSFQWAPGHRG